MELHPFRALRPPRELVAQVASPPYDVMNSAEAREYVQGKPNSFLNVVKPEVNLPEDISIYSDQVYQEAGAQLRRLEEEGALVRDQGPALWLYRLIMDGRAQFGMVGCSNVDDYVSGLIKKHEFTRPDKEDDRTRHVDETNAHTGPVFLACRSTPALRALQDACSASEPEFDFCAADGIQHTLWRVDDASLLHRAAQAYAGVDCFYVADGHHRAASAWRVRELRRERGQGGGPAERFLTVVFPADQLSIMAYNRYVHDLNGLDTAAFLQKIEECFEVGEPSSETIPKQRHEIAMYLDGQWRMLRIRSGRVDESDAVARLDVAILQELLLAPVLGIDDPRTNERIKFVGGIRGSAELVRLVDGGGGVAFSMYATSIEELFSVADADRVMPPKSTWFEPKLASGIIVHPLD
ncbi:MAG: hypothetical protein CMH54_02985 [Myxococcales bacterium]|nr:hypothetical protein [Myxococcales bacterium]